MSVVFMVLLILIGGVALACIARFARRRSEQLRRAGVTQWPAPGSTSRAEWVQLQFFGPQPRVLELLGPILAWGVIAFVVVVLGAVVVIAITALSR
jgi:hypothetical protein